jgi:hypothetical protein
MRMPFIVESKDGWEPSRSTIRGLQRKARKLGLIWDWPTIAVLESHDLLLDCEEVTGENGADLIAFKQCGKWHFKIDGDYVNEERIENA